MRKHLLGLMLIAGLAGCTSESDSDLARTTSDATAETGVAASGTPTQASLAALRGATTNFASLPDRGELLSYGGIRKTRQSGAYTYHPVAISEAHALNAIGGGEMVVNTPDGQALRLKYERHEEQADGNWTWIGSSSDGSNAVLTFGEKAVFGMVSKGDDYYRVRTDRTGAWVVATDRSLVAANGGKRQSGEDFLLPPEGGMLTAAASQHLAKAEPAAAVTEKAVAVVDVLIGYSNGLASAYGSQAAASTFVTSLVAMTNAAYANSGVNMRLRAVHTLQVNYADTSDNQDALQQLTGYNVTTQQPITPNAAFNALRAARDEYGADLVAFVRRYREPEQDGCGIAWLLGMNQSGISVANDAEFGYAVISDGEDRDESDNNTYFCSDYSLAHELGHLMGQAHNSQDAQGRAGVHTYSYGYRESSATGFYTIMAYPSGDSQVEIANFANPSVNVAGRPTGVANQSDNVRSMNVTMPLISTFRATRVPLESGWEITGVGDANNDNRSDIFWHNSGSQRFEFWRMNGAAIASYGAAAYIQDKYVVAGTGDFNGDGRTDILWRDIANTQVWIWEATAAGGWTSKYVRGYPTGWNIVGVGDTNNDGRDDIFWHNPTTGRLQAWRMNGATFTYGPLNAIGAYTVEGVGDFNGDGRADLIWVNTARTQVWLWLGNSAGTYASVYVRAYPTGWSIAGTGDVDNDGRSDIFWHNRTAQRLQYWKMNGAAFTYGPSLFVMSKYIVAGVGDFNADGRADILWRDESRRELWQWQALANGQFTTLSMRAYPQ